MSGTRDENVFMARLAEQAERYEDMVHCMTGVANMGSELSLEERNLLSVAFKNAVGARRTAWRQIVAMMAKEEPAGSPPPCVVAYKTKVEEELNTKCEEILSLIRKEPDGLISSASTVEAQVFYRKMEGDYYRYLAEFSSGEKQVQHANSANIAYRQALEMASAPTGLSPIHPIRLGLALNFSVFYYEVYGNAADACKLASDAVGLASAAAGEGIQPDADAILRLLSDNLNLWKSDSAAQGEGKPPEQDGTLCEDL